MLRSCSLSRGGALALLAVLALGGGLPAQTTIIDNSSGSGFSAPGWTPFSGQGHLDNVAFTDTGTGSLVATWTFTGLTPGQYRVSATWSPHPNRPTDARYTVLDGSLTLATVTRNQELAPDDVTDTSGTRFEHLGNPYTVTSGTLVVRLTNQSTQGGQHVIADAIRVQRTADLPAAAEIQVRQGNTELTDGSSTVNFGTTTVGTPVNRTFTVRNLGQASLTLQTPITVPSGFTVTTSFGATTLAAGASTTFVVRLDATATGTFSGPLSFGNNDADENPFNFTVSGTVNAGTGSNPQIIDNRDPGYSEPTAGRWADWALGYNGNSRYTDPGTGAVARWQATGLAPGQYLVQATWPADTASNAPYRIYDGDTLRTTVNVNQTSEPNGSGGTFGGRPFQNLATVTVNSGTLRVDLLGDPSGYVIADAIRYQGAAASAPEIQVLDNGTDIPDGSGTANFGNTTVGTPVTKTFTVRNLGTANLTLQAPITVPAGYTVTQSFGSTTLAPNASTTFVVQLNAASGGTFAGQLSFGNNDPNENPFNFNLTGQVIAPGPEIQVLQGATNIADGTGSVNFGTTAQGTAVTRTFTVRNQGDSPLTLTPPVSVPAGFTVTQSFGATSLGSGESTTFIVQLNATSSGTFSGELSFANNDADENPFNFTISGAVVTAGPEIVVLDGSTEVPDNSGSVNFGSTQVGSPVSKTFTVRNAGTSDLTLQAPVTVPNGFTVTQSFGATTVPPNGTTTFVVRLDASAAGSFSGQLSFGNNDSDENPYNFTVSGTATAQTIANIIDDRDPGYSEPTAGRWADWALGYNGNSRYTDPGTGAVARWQATGLAPGQYLVQATWPADTASNATYRIYDNSNLVQTVNVNQTAEPVGPAFGGRPFQTLATVQISSGTLRVELSGDPSGYVIADAIRYSSSGPQQVPEIAVLDGTTNIPDNTGAVSFGTATVGQPISKTFTVQNTGSANLTLQTPIAVPSGFTVTASFGSTTVPAGGSTTFTVRLDAVTAGSFSGELSFGNNDSDENPFNFTISGTVNAATAPEIVVLDGTTEVPDNSGSVSFGTTLVGTPVSKTFTVRNDGTANLTLQTPITVPAGFTVTASFGSTTLAPGASTTFTVRLDAAAAGSFSGSLSFGNNDSDENPYNFTISGTVNQTAPEIEVADGTALIPDNTGTVAFGNTVQGTPVSKTFTVRNDGSANLTLQTPITVPAGFTVTASFGSTTLAPGASTTFTVRLDAAAPGSFSGTLSFGNNDADENPFDFTISGAVAPPPAPEITVLDGSTVIADNTGNVGFGSTPLGSPVTRTFTVRNDGDANLTLQTPITVPAGFTVTASFGSTTLAPGASTTFTVRLDAAVAGTFSGQVSFGNNDGDENPFNFNVTGSVNATNPNVVIIDDGDAGFVTTPSGPPWQSLTGSGFGNDITFMTATGSGSNFATWTFTSLTPGQYRVSATWTAAANRSTAAPYVITDGPGGTTSPPPITVTVNQSVAPNGFPDQGAQWEDLAIITITGNTLAVRLTDAAAAQGSGSSGVIVADAVRIERQTVNQPTELDTIRFLEQATWGPNNAGIARARQLGFESWLTEQLALASGSNYPTPPTVSTDNNQPIPVGCNNGTAIDPVCNRDNYTPYPLQRQFYTQALYGNDQLRQRVAFALHKILVVSFTDPDTNLPYRVAPYLQVLDRNALGDGSNYAFNGQLFPRGNFRTLLLEMTLNAGMGQFLDMANSTVSIPNENYAREVLQLFSIGLFLTNPDGTLQRDGSGNPIDTYTQNDILQLSKVFTGWTFAPRDAALDPTGTVNYRDRMRLANTPNPAPGAAENAANHDFTAKTFLGQTIPARTASVANANQDLLDAINIIFNHPNTGPFIGQQLIQMLVTSNPSPGYVARVTAVFNDNGLGVRGDLKSVVRAVLLDQEARGDHKDANQNPAFAGYGKLREPIQHQLNLLRAFGARSFDGTTTSDGVIASNGFVTTSGQNAFAPPSVFAYFLPDSPLPNSTTLVGPEFGIMNSTSVFAKANFIDLLVGPAAANTTLNVGITVAAPDRPNGTSLDLTGLANLAQSDTSLNTLLNELNRLLMHGTMSAAMRNEIINAVTTGVPAAQPLKRARWAAHLVVTSSQYQVQQ